MSTLEAFGFQRRKQQQQQPKPVELLKPCMPSIEPALNAAHPWLCASPQAKPIESSSIRSAEKQFITTKPKKAKGKAKTNGNITQYLHVQQQPVDKEPSCVIRKQIPFHQTWQALLQDYTTKRRRYSETEERPQKKIQVDHDFLAQFQQMLCVGGAMECDEEHQQVILRRQMTAAESMTYIHTIVQEFSI